MTLARTTTFEEVAHLLWFGHLPNEKELADLHQKFVAERTIPDPVMQIIRNSSNPNRTNGCPAYGSISLGSALYFWHPHH